MTYVVLLPDFQSEAKLMADAGELMREPKWKASAHREGAPRGTAPALPDFLADAYRQAWDTLPRFALRDLVRTTDQTATQSALGVIAWSRGPAASAKLANKHRWHEIEEMVAKYQKP